MVLPFLVQCESSAANGSCSLAIADHLIRLLTHSPGIRVLSRISAAQLCRRFDALPAEKPIGVNFIIEGTVAHSAVDCHLIVHLSETSEGYNIWSSYYEPNAHPAIELANQIAHDVIHEIHALRLLDLNNSRRNTLR
jgi:TolB-like protein